MDDEAQRMTFLQDNVRSPSLQQWEFPSEHLALETFVIDGGFLAPGTTEQGQGI